MSDKIKISAEIMTALHWAVKQNCFVDSSDRELIYRVAECAGQGIVDKHSIGHAARCIQSIRAERRMPEAIAYVETIPIRKRVNAAEKGGRFYWRVLLENPGCEGGPVYLAAVKDTDKHVGTLQTTKSYARDLYCKGTKVIELIPPDYDPQSADSEWTENRANFQPQGMTVRQRTKKH